MKDFYKFLLKDQPSTDLELSHILSDFHKNLEMLEITLELNNVIYESDDFFIYKIDNFGNDGKYILVGTNDKSIITSAMLIKKREKIDRIDGIWSSKIHKNNLQKIFQNVKYEIIDTEDYFEKRKSLAFNLSFLKSANSIVDNKWKNVSLYFNGDFIRKYEFPFKTDLIIKDLCERCRENNYSFFFRYESTK